MVDLLDLEPVFKTPIEMYVKYFLELEKYPHEFIIRVEFSIHKEKNLHCLTLCLSK